MRFEIRHEIEYKYSKPVFHEPHVFFLKPREDSSQKIHSFHLSVDPVPAGKSFFADPFGNDSMRAWFDRMTDVLRVRMRADVEIFRPNPFDYLPEPGFSGFPVRYSPAVEKVLRFYLYAAQISGPVAALSRQIAARTGASVAEFLPELCRAIAGSFTVIHRPEGAPWPASQTFESRQGSCRDLTVLFIECCRTQGLAARFVSGYFEGDAAKPEKELHAWAEVFVEGGGWRGFDPTHGLAVAGSHVAIASAWPPELVSPVTGAYRGDASSSLRTRVEISRK